VTPFWLSILLFGAIILGFGFDAYRDVSRPEAWAYWKDLYFSPSLNASLILNTNFGSSGQVRRTLVVRGTIGAAAASWLRDRLEETHLAADDVILLSSPGGNLNQAMLMGEIIRARGLSTAVGAANSSGQVGPAYCASACVLVYAGGKTRYGVQGSRLGVHRFVATAQADDPVADTQRTQGFVLGYMTKMGVSSAVVEAMSQTREVRWLGAREALAMNLVTEPIGKR
jgi:hypothetical protein